MMNRLFTCLAVFAALLLTIDTGFAQETPIGRSASHETAAPAPLAAPLVKRYTIPYFTSFGGVVTAPNATQITVLNASSRTCDIKVQFFSAVEPTIPVCDLTLTVPPGIGGHFCSANMSSSIYVCAAPCAPALQDTSGKAIVSSSNLLGCQNLMVDAAVSYFEDGTAAKVVAQRQLTVVKGLLSKGQ